MRLNLIVYYTPGDRLTMMYYYYYYSLNGIELYTDSESLHHLIEQSNYVPSGYLFGRSTTGLHEIKSDRILRLIS